MAKKQQSRLLSSSAGTEDAGRTKVSPFLIKKKEKEKKKKLASSVAEIEVSGM